MRRTIHVLGLALATCVLPALDGAAWAQRKAPARPAAEDAVARVNGHPILRSEFDLAVQLRFRGRRVGSVSHAELDATRDQVLDELIEGELVYQKAGKSAAAVSDREVQDELDRIRKGFASPGDFTARLKDNGVSEQEFKEHLRHDRVVARFLDGEVVKDLKVSDEEVRRYYDEHPDETTRPEGVRVSQIVVHAKLDAAPAARAEARQKIEEIMMELKAGKEFAEMARIYSEGPEAARGGDSGYVTHGGKALPAIERAAFALQPGQTSDILETRRGFHIIKVTGRRPAGPAPFDEIKEAIRTKLVARAREARIHDYVAGLKSSSRIERTPAGPSK